MIHKKNKVIISVTDDHDILFIKKCTRNADITTRLATFLSHDKIYSPITNNHTGLASDFAAYLQEKLDRLRANEVITIEITTHKKSY